MMNPPLNIFSHWLATTPELLKQLCVVMVIAYLAIRIRLIRQAIKGSETQWRFRIITATFFGSLAILGTLSGIVVNISAPEFTVKLLSKAANQLESSEAIIGFRDTMALSAGLCAGPWVGLGAGLLGGYHRYSLGGFVALASGLSTLLLGLGAGLARLFWKKASTPLGTMLVALIGTGLHRLLLLTLANSSSDAISLTWETLIPVTVANCFGCLVFRLVLQDLERDRLKYEMKQQELERQRLKFQAKQAEFRALQAQVEPHFINNTLNAIKALIRIDASKASDYIVKLARFLDETRQMAKLNSIQLGLEISHLQRYLEFQQLRFHDAFTFTVDIPPTLRECLIPPRCLLTLAENALVHGLSGHSGCLSIRVECFAEEEYLIMQVIDDGSGMPEERLLDLGKRPVASERGSGNGLFQLQEALQLAFDGAAKLEVSSTLGAGTLVSLTLPIRSEAW